MKKKLKCFVCHKEINEEEDYVFKGQTVHKGVCLKSMIDEYNTIRNLQIRNKRLCSEIDRLNNIINEIENTIENFMETHTEGYIDWKYDREIYLAERNVLEKLYDTYFEKLQELKENK